jgi:hypothetical protein
MANDTDHLSVSLPDQKNYEISYGLALKLASEKLASLSDLEEQCRKSDSVCRVSDSSSAVFLKYFNRTLQVTLPDANVSVPGSPEKIDLRDKILILHYLVHSRGTPLTGKLIAYQELQEGAAYYPSFFKRAVKPLIDYFGANPNKLLEIAGNLGGYKAYYGDTSVTIPAFSRVPITVVIWRGDDEFPPNANILFDSTIQDYLPVEDINVLCQTITWQMIKSL